MPRTARASVGGTCYHVINRGNRRARVFHHPSDYQAFVDLMARSSAKVPMRVLGYCLMPNHFHFILYPFGDGDLSRWMQRLMTAHVRRYHKKYGTDGRIWQGRFKAFPIEQDRHLLTVLRYVERNPLRARLSNTAESWPWSSLSAGMTVRRSLLSEMAPEACAADWIEFVNAPQTTEEVEAIRECVVRGRPFGHQAWRLKVAEELGLEASIRPRGRPRKS